MQESDLSLIKKGRKILSISGHSFQLWEFRYQTMLTHSLVTYKGDTRCATGGTKTTFTMLCCSKCFTHFLNAKALQVFEHYEARQLGWTFVFVGRLLQKYHAPFGGNIFWARKPAGLEQSRPALHDTPHSLSQIVLCTCALFEIFSTVICCH